MNLRLEWKLKRIRSGWKATDLAQMLKVDKSTLSKYERSQGNLKPYVERQYQQLIISKLEGEIA